MPFDLLSNFPSLLAREHNVRGSYTYLMHRDLKVRKVYQS